MARPAAPRAESAFPAPAGGPPAVFHAGFCVAAAVGPAGGLYSWGDGAHGCLGQGHISACHAPRPVRALAGCTVRALAAGGAHVLVAAADGRVFAWGLNRHGQLGVGTRARHTAPVEVRHSLSPSPPCSTLSMHPSLHRARRRSDAATTMASPHSPHSPHPPVPTPHLTRRARGAGQVEHLRGAGVVAVAAGGDFSGFVGGAGALYTCGAGWDGQLGLGDRAGLAPPPLSY